ncbi:putative 2-succinyl-6-hydroxy-2,4-cyclohexadiene-1-carboxylate synthase [Reticulibacter mediterranei]|uniref:Putative 2-succinyl-6-hydroxy-2,4-cyclohexadiene-1-carboxylate synthase n=1 Tax=Reticulibacter mediterranei TaxID=2778369 RepID=A0A8J3IQU1_9CHLR|nr:2-succinyl-6-hydroxy-2,4-cyclohexadiene-1-carboxylate synthase [Reticulibacter mediterranei]GHO95190.1 putative 2-succinyl-6-hydroxy-2,4-cyclohexadiene-1-carboxylate synthase [Reticulibacter mediterranei]
MRLRVNGVYISIEQRGKASQRPLVLLHGFTGSARGWGSLLDKLANSFHVIALDMLGHGLSDEPNEPERYSMEHCRADIIAVLQKLGIQANEAILLGYSMGGRIALYTAFSGYFRALILESASPGIADPDEREQRRKSDSALADRIEREGVAAFVHYWERLPLFASQDALSPEQQEALHQQRLNNTAHGLANCLRGVGTGTQPALHDALPELILPVLLLTGELDKKFCAIAQDMKFQLPHAQWSVVPGAGHTVHLEQPEQFVQLVVEFCATL